MLKSKIFETSVGNICHKIFVPVQMILLVSVFTVFSAMNCTEKETGNDMTLIFDSIPVSHRVIPAINEASGIADSKINPGNIWLEEDSDNPPEITLLKHDGTVAKKIFLEGAVNRDWEDMALYNDSIYIADIGDNDKVYNQYFFYIFQEPSSSIDTVKSYKKISFMYPDGSHNAEAFLMDRKSGDIFIITKNDNPSRVYRLTAPYSIQVNMLTLVGKLNYTGVVSAAISDDDKEVIVKTYLSLNYYKRKSGENILACLLQSPKLLPYTLEPQGEAVCFSQGMSGFFTLSEKGLASFINLYFYPRK